MNSKEFLERRLQLYIKINQLVLEVKQVTTHDFLTISKHFSGWKIVFDVILAIVQLSFKTSTAKISSPWHRTGFLQDENNLVILNLKLNNVIFDLIVTVPMKVQMNFIISLCIMIITCLSLH